MKYQRILALTINPGLAIVGILPPVGYGVSYSATLVGYGGIEPYQWALVSGFLPAGLSFGVDSNGDFVLSGTTSAVGLYPITVILRDSSGKSVTRQFNLRVVAEPLVIAGSAPDGDVGVPYSYTYTVSGGVQPYMFGLISSYLPDGLYITSGPGADEVTIEGTPTVSAVNHSFTIGVWDAQTPTAAYAQITDTISIVSVSYHIMTEVGDAIAAESGDLLRTE